MSKINNLFDKIFKIKNLINKFKCLKKVNTFKVASLLILAIFAAFLFANFTFDSQFSVAAVAGSSGAGIGNREQQSLNSNLHKALSEGNLEKCEEYIKLGADINAVGADGKTPLITSVLSGNIDYVRFFLDKGANPNKGYSTNKNKVIRDARSEYLVPLDICKSADMARLLIKSGSDVNFKSFSRVMTSLTRNIFTGDLEVAKVLIENGAKLNDIDENGDTLLMNTISFPTATHIHNSPKIHAGIDGIRLLLENGVDINATNKQGQTALMVAILNGRSDVAKLIIEKGANVNIKDKDGKTAFMLAIVEGNFELAKIILDKGADINAVDNDGRTALLLLFSDEKSLSVLYSSEFKQKFLNDAVRFFVKNRANLNIKDKSGETVLRDILRYRWNLKFTTKYSFFEVDKNKYIKNGDYSLDKTIKELILGGADSNIKDKEGHSCFWWAVKAVVPSDIIKIMLEKGANVNLTDNEGNVPLHTVAASECNEYVMDEFSIGVNGVYPLKETGQKWIDVALNEIPRARLRIINDSRSPSIFGATPEHIHQIKKLILDNFDNTKINNDNFRLLLKYGSKVDIKNNKGETPLMVAVANRDLEILKILIEKGADINLADNNGETPLMRAASLSNCNYDITRILLESGKLKNINFQDNKGKTALMHFIEKGGKERGSKCAYLMLEKNADPYIKDKEGNNAFNYLIATNLIANEVKCDPLVNLFIKYASKPGTADIKDGKGCSLLISAFKYVRVSSKIRDFLLAKANDVNLTDSEGKNALMYAVGKWYKGESIEQVLNYVNTLIKKGCNVNAKSKDGSTAFMFAVGNGNMACAGTLLNNGADINVKNNDGLTALMQTTNTKMIEFLLQNKIDINATDNNGFTALDYVVKKGDFEAAKVLIKNNAKFDIKNKRYKDFFLSCVKNNKTELIRLFLEHNVNVNEKNEDGDTALCIACKQGLSDYEFVYTIRLLLENGANINVKDSNGETPLMISTKYKDSDIMKLFVQKGADVNVKDSNGETAIIKAVKNANNYTVAMSSILIENGANLKIKDNSGKTVFDYLPSSGFIAKNIRDYFERIK